MKISEQWLREWVNPSLSVDELVAQITMAGLEVDAIEPVAGTFSAVVVAEIIAIEQHPDADKLRVCQVACGEEDPVQVVCGAANARLGLKAPFAKVGAVLPGDFKIKKAKLRGVPSFGMLCGASELGMEDQIDGLMELPSDADVGMDIRQYLALDDNIIDIDLTPNRGDCLSVLGTAREIGVLNKIDLSAINAEPVSASIETVFPATVTAAQDCPRYACRVIEGVNVNASTPLWMVEKLRRSGVRSIDPVVDVTNFVMLELGQPMHAFDLSTVEGQIEVRKASDKEKITLLDGQTLELDNDALVIADKAKPLALAGIMGGQDSGVSAQTANILLEAAFFEPVAIAGRARSYGLHTDSSHRFERGVDSTQQVRAIERATALLLDIVGGQAGPVSEITTDDVASSQSVSLKSARLEQVLGLSIPTADVTEMLERLGLIVEATSEGWLCQVPSYRFDIAIEADLVEEVARIYGYNNLPTRQLKVPVQFKARSEAVRPLSRIRHQLQALGYQEAITYSFIEPKHQALFCDESPVAVANPISSELGVMRTSLIPGLISAMQHNINRQQTRVRLFESGLQFHAAADAVKQDKYLAGLIFGAQQEEAWSNSSKAVDFFDIKGDVQSVLTACGNSDAEFVKAQHKALHPGQTAEVRINGEKAGVLGALHPEIAKTLGITGSVFVFELSLEKILKGNVPTFNTLSKFPQVRRDIAVIIDQAIEAQQVMDIVREHAGEYHTNAQVFDVYQGQGIEENKKSLAVALHFQHPERSLNDEEIQELMDRVITALTDKLGASLRG